MIIALLPIAGIVFIVLIIIAIIASCFGNEETLIRRNFTLPFNSKNYTITSPFSVRIDPISGETKEHKAIDVVPNETTDILAVADGIVTESSVDGYGAEYVIIEHNIGNNKYKTGYWHLKEDSRIVNVGDQVKQGQQIGIMGDTGYSTGAHLHFFLQEYNKNKKEYEYKDPNIIFKYKLLPEHVNLYDYENNKFHNSDYLDDKFQLFDPSIKYDSSITTPK